MRVYKVLSDKQFEKLIIRQNDDGEYLLVDVAVHRIRRRNLTGKDIAQLVQAFENPKTGYEIFRREALIYDRLSEEEIRKMYEVEMLVEGLDP